MAESKNIIEFLQMEQTSSMWEQDELKQMFVTARDNIFGCSNVLATEKETTKDPSPSNNFDAMEKISTADLYLLSFYVIHCYNIRLYYLIYNIEIRL